MTPSIDLAAVLALFGLSPHDAGVAAIGLAAAGYAVTWVAAALPPPDATTGRGGRFVYGLIQGIAGNVAHARNAASVPPAVK